MAGPWEQYQQPAAAPTGPWAQYQQPSAPAMQIGTGVEAIPGQRSISQKETPVSMRDRIMGVAELPAVVAGGIASGIAAPIAAMYGELASPAKQGSPEARAAGEAIATKARQQFYQPRTQTSQEIMGSVAPVMEALGAVPSVNALQLSQGAGPALRAVGDTRAAQMAQYTNRGQALETSKNIAKSYANAPLLDATKAAERVGLVVDPSVTNPTLSNKLKGAAVGSSFKDLAAETNSTNVTNAIRKDLGVDPTQPLDHAAVKTALDKASVAYEPVRKMESLSVPKESIDALEKLKKQAPIGGERETASVNKLISEALDKLQKTTPGAFSGVGGERVHVGRNGAAVLDDIRAMRDDANSIYKAQAVNPDSLAKASADAKMAIANILEGVIDANAPNPKVLREMREGRTRMGQIYDHDRAINYANGTVDPQVYAKLLDERKGNMTGVGADIGKVAATFPDLMSVQTPSSPLMPTVKRSGIGAAAGALIGGAVGNYPGAIAGATLGAAAGGVSTKGLARKMVSPEYQASRAMPVDYRPPVNNLRPADINYGPNQLVPYNYAQATTEAPNFVMRPNEYPPKATFVGPDMGVPQLPAPSGESTMNALAAEKARAAQMSRTLGQQAEAKQAAAEAAARQPTRGAVELQINPLTGVPEVSKGLKGATPEVFQDFGTSLKSASEKVAKGQSFAMDAAELSAWKRTTADLAEVMPGFKALDPKVLAERMMDRKWVADALEKSRQKAAMFDDLAKRTADDISRRDAAAKREQLLDLADILEENLRGGRPVSKGGQGPKTRAHQRNMLSPEQETQNRLIIEISGVGQRK